MKKLPASMTAAQYQAFLKKPAATKYHNVRLKFEDESYDSKAELEFEMRLRLLKSLGKVAWWIRQVPFVLPGGLRRRTCQGPDPPPTQRRGEERGRPWLQPGPTPEI